MAVTGGGSFGTGLPCLRNTALELPRSLPERPDAFDVGVLGSEAQTNPEDLFCHF